MIHRLVIDIHILIGGDHSGVVRYALDDPLGCHWLVMAAHWRVKAIARMSPELEKEPSRAPACRLVSWVSMVEAGAPADLTKVDCNPLAV